MAIPSCQGVGAGRSEARTRPLDSSEGPQGLAREVAKAKRRPALAASQARAGA